MWMVLGVMGFFWLEAITGSGPIGGRGMGSGSGVNIMSKEGESS